MQTSAISYKSVFNSSYFSSSSENTFISEKPFENSSKYSDKKADSWIYFSDVSDDVRVNMKIENQPNTTFPEIGTPKTGDSSDFVLYTALILGSVVILFLGV